MDSKEAYKNWNYMYEYKLFDEWCPCHVLTDPPLHFLKEGYCSLYNAYGSVDTVSLNVVRKLTKEKYLELRKESFEWLGKNFDIRRLGFHRNIEDDLKIYDQANDLSLCVTNKEKYIDEVE